MTATYRQLLQDHASGAALDRLVRYAELLERWASRHSLVRFSSRQELVTRHIGDALAAVPFVRGSRRLLDVGSGAGLPGVPLLAVLDDLQGTLLEPRAKRWAFLRTVVRELALEARVERCRYQELPPTVERWHAITVRAVGQQPAIVDWARARLADGGQVMVWTTARGEAVLCECRGWRVLSSPLPGLDSGRLVRLQPCST